MEPIETEKYRGYVIDIHVDDDPINPQRDYDQLGTMVCFHRSYDLGNEDHGYDEGDYTGWQGLHDAILSDHPGAAILPLSLIDHSGISMYVAAGAHACDPGGWDSGQVGWTFASCKKAADWLGDSRTTGSAVMAKAADLLAAEVKEYDYYLTGQCYGYVAHTKAGETIGSGWGFLGDADYAMTEARGEVDAHIVWLDRELDDVRDVTKGIALVALGGGAS